MAGFTALLFTYLIGGLTFLPLVILGIFIHGYIYLPPTHGLRLAEDHSIHEGERDQGLEAKLAKQGNESDGASGTFAVCREFVPGGINGKPPERVTATGETVATDSPSVYQSMYRSIFDRNKAQQPSVEPNKTSRKGRNWFFVALRHSHLVLFDNEQQLEIRHVISLAHHVVDIYAGGGDIPEGELWIKRNCIRLRKKPSLFENDAPSPPFYLFSENCSHKEDFYHALLRNQRQDPDLHQIIPAPLNFETDDMIKLIRQLHTAEESPQTRWLNALLGRLFLALYKTNEVENHIRNKIKKKISRVAKPAFVSSLTLQHVDMGDSAPSFMNPKLKEMTVDGALTFEADVRYSGNFKAVIAAVARIDLGSKMKAREVSLVLAGILKKLEGHVVFKMKPPPSNRIWFAFETMPKLDISLEPVVSQRQITYGVILRAMVGRIREVIGETLVLPNWDDIPFMNTEGKGTRAGIWKPSEGPESFTEAEKFMEKRGSEASDHTSLHAEVATSDAGSVGIDTTVDVDSSAITSPTDSPARSRSPGPGSALDPGHRSAASISTPTATQAIGPEKPKAMRSHSFASAATPIVSKSPATTEGTRRRSKKGRKDAASTMQDIASRSPELSPVHSPSRSALDGRQDFAELTGRSLHDFDEKIDTQSEANDRLDSLSSVSSEAPIVPRLRAASMTDPVVSPTRSTTTRERTKALNHSLTAATAAASKWGLGMLNMQERKEGTPSEKPARPEPMGRGQPLPPPGMPLPKPERNTWSAAAFNSLRRKPVNSISHASDSGKTTELSASPSVTGKTPPSVEKEIKERSSSPSLRIHPPQEEMGSGRSSKHDNLMTISAPQESAPSTPRPQTPEPEYAKMMGDSALASPLSGG